MLSYVRIWAWVLLLSPSIFISSNASHASNWDDISGHPTQLTRAIPTFLKTFREELHFLIDPDQNQIFSPVPASPSPFSIFPQANSSDVSRSDLSQASCPTKMLVMCYYPDWAGDTFPPEKINFKLFDWIDFAFAVPSASFALTWDDQKKGPDLLQRLVRAAHSNGTKVKLSIGGWTGSKYFSSAVSTEDSRKIFASNILDIYTTFGLDGIDIDWEYPGRNGAPGNGAHPSDSANFLLFLKVLRAALPSSARISAAVETTTFVDNLGKPMKDLSEFGQVLDWVLLMNYDVWESSSAPGPNAPLQDACGNSTQPNANAVTAFDAWSTANFPICKIVLGLPSYGYISSSNAQHLRTRSKTGRKQRHPKTLKVVNDDGGSEGQVQFNALVKQGALKRTTSIGHDGRNATLFIAGAGFERRWDSCSDTPFLRSSASHQIISYDDLESLSMKATFAKGVKMLGVNIFDVHGDTDNWDLTNCIREAMGLE